MRRQGKKKQQGATKTVHIARMVCAVASRLNLTRAKDGARLAAIKVFPT